MWDLRNANAPEKTLRLHEQGVLSLAWSAQDPSLLLSCGKDNRTICWNARSGEAYGEFPIVTNWTFETNWNPRQPGILATASFDGKIGVQTIQNTNTNASKSAAAPALDDADFFAQAGSQPQGAAFSLSKAPKWLERPVSATFGFGGKLVKIGPADATSRTSKLSISTFVADSSVGDAAEKFENVLKKADYAEFCESKISEAKTEEEKADWTVIETLISGSRTGLRDYLGFAPAKPEANGEVEQKQTNGDAAADDDSAFFGGDSTDDNFLSTLASTKGARTINPFKIYTGSESEADKQITKALMLGSFDEAVNVCLKEDRISDAFMIAICGGQKCIDKVQAAYFKKKSDGPNYLRLLASVVGKNLWDVVYNADLANWKEVLATLCTFADEKEFPDLCEALGDRLEESLEEGSESQVARKDASFCYLAGSKLEKVVAIWTQELHENEKAALASGEADSAFSVHARALQDFIEKVTVFREVTKFSDPDAAKAEGWKLEPLYSKYAEYADILASNGKAPLASRYLDLVPEGFAPAAAAKGRVKKPVAKAAAAVTAAAVQPRQSSLPGATRGQRVVPAYGAQPGATPAATSSPYAPAAFGASTPAATQPVQSSYQPPGGQGGYTPAGYQPPTQNSYAPSAGYQPSAPSSNPYGGYQANTFGGGIAPPPPRQASASPALQPAATNRNLQTWNDTPDFGPKPQVSRRGTPAFGQPPVSNPYAPQPSANPPPTSFSPPTAKPLAPPPKAGAPRVMSPPTVEQVHQQETSRPSSSAANAYAPTSLSQSYGSPAAQGVPPIPRGASPYNPPPSTGPTNSRYAPAPGSAPSPAPGFGGGPPLGGRQVAPPPTGSNYAPNPAGYAPSPYSQPPPQASAAAFSKPTPPPPAAPAPPPKGPAHGTPPPGPSRANHRPAGSVNQLPPPQRSTSRPPTGEGANPPAAPKYPAGDRSHIPAHSQQLYQTLDAEMQRIKAKAPAQFRPQVLDTEKRLSILFDHLNNDDLLGPDAVQELNGLAEALRGRQYERAQGIFQDVMTSKTDGGDQWMTWLVS
jgi:protein transport protein SEC31